jgi:hypothetical protein
MRSSRRKLKFRYIDDEAFAADVFSPTHAFFWASISRSNSGPDQRRKVVVQKTSSKNFINGRNARSVGWSI